MARVLAFACAATSIAALLAEFYAVASLRAATLYLFLPAAAVLVWLWIRDRRGEGRLASDLAAGAWAGLVAACAYDLFRVPFVLAEMPLFKVFPLFGALITGLPAGHWAASGSRRPGSSSPSPS